MEANHINRIAACASLGLVAALSLGAFRAAHQGFEAPLRHALAEALRVAPETVSVGRARLTLRGSFRVTDLGAGMVGARRIELFFNLRESWRRGRPVFSRAEVDEAVVEALGSAKRAVISFHGRSLEARLSGVEVTWLDKEVRIPELLLAFAGDALVVSATEANGETLRHLTDAIASASGLSTLRVTRKGLRLRLRREHQQLAGQIELDRPPFSRVPRLPFGFSQVRGTLEIGAPFKQPTASFDLEL